jgi:predicted ATPase/DNA-binding winged helix-turn-helix (wHTH) protein
MRRAIRRPESAAVINDGILEFGQYRLDVGRRLLIKGHRHVRVPSRALSILVVLAERAGRVVGKRELQALVWPNATVEEGTLRVHVTALRKILGETPEGLRFIQNVPGQGYCLAVPVRDVSAAATQGAGSVGSTTPARFVLRSMDLRAERELIGRDSCVKHIVTTLYERRLVTVTGPGGIGKTAVMNGVVEALAPDYCAGMWVVDLASVEASHHVAAAVALTLGVASPEADPLPAILAVLQERSSVLVLDNCERVLDGAALLVQAVLNAAPQTRILTTSREQLHVHCERVYRLPPLEVPSADGLPTRHSLLESSAVTLFLKRAAMVTDMELCDEDLLLVAQLCGRLEGNPLAIEIAAARLDVLGLRGLVASFDQGHHLSMVGPRAQRARHRTLRESLEFSYGLLSDSEQRIFRRLGVFRGYFDLAAATTVVSEGTADAGDVFEVLLNLISKSLLVCESDAGSIRYRLQEMSRVYALAKLQECEELEHARSQHALWWCGGGAQALYAQLRGGADRLALFNRCVADLRDAIQWCFSNRARVSAAAHWGLFVLWTQLTVAVESSVWNTAELLERARRGCPLLEKTLLLQRQTHIAIDISVAAVQLELSDASMDPVLALIHHYAGNLSRARRHAERAIARDEEGHECSKEQRLQRAQLRVVLARSLWLQGLADSAMAAMRGAVMDAHGSGDLQMLGGCQVVAALLASVLGYREARILTDLVRQHASRHGTELMQLWTVCLEDLLEPQFEASTQPIWTALADGCEGAQSLEFLGALREEWMSADAIMRAEQGLGGWLAAEALRVKAERIVQVGGLEAASEADGLLQQAAAIAEAQGALVWEHRVAMSQARLLQRQSRTEDARELLMKARARFSEGLQTTDLLKSEQLLDELDRGAQERLGEGQCEIRPLRRNSS